jgi:hypothetical protein
VTRTGQAAIDYARSRVGTQMPEGSGYCLKFVRDCFAVPSCYPSAIDAWNASPTKHPGDRNPPPAVPLYFLTPSVYDHVVFCVSTTEIISTFNADIRRFSGISDIERQFSGSYLGWTEDINRVTVWTPSSSLAPDGEDDFMSALSSDEQRRVLQAADTWNTWAASIKTNNDRLPHIHAQADTSVAQGDNITNGVVELLDALHAFQAFLSGQPAGTRWRSPFDHDADGDVDERDEAEHHRGRRHEP